MYLFIYLLTYYVLFINVLCNFTSFFSWQKSRGVTIKMKPLLIQLHRAAFIFCCARRNLRLLLNLRLLRS